MSARRGVTWWKVLLGCAGVLFLTTMVVGVIAYYKIKAALTNTIVSEPAKVLALEEGMVPGAQLPVGFAGKMGMDTRFMRMATFADKEGKVLTVMCVPSDKKLSQDDLQKGYEEQTIKDGKSEHKVIVKQVPLEVPTAGSKVVGRRMLVEADGLKMTRVTAFGHAPGDSKTAILVSAEVQKENASLTFFLDYMKTVKLEPLE